MMKQNPQSLIRSWGLALIAALSLSCVENSSGISLPLTDYAGFQRGCNRLGLVVLRGKGEWGIGNDGGEIGPSLGKTLREAAIRYRDADGYPTQRVIIAPDRQCSAVEIARVTYIARRLGYWKFELQGKSSKVTEDVGVATTTISFWYPHEDYPSQMESLLSNISRAASDPVNISVCFQETETPLAYSVLGELHVQHWDRARKVDFRRDLMKLTSCYNRDAVLLVIRVGPSATAQDLVTVLDEALLLGMRYFIVPIE